VLGCSLLSWDLEGGAGTPLSFAVVHPLHGGAVSCTHPPCEQVLAAMEGLSLWWVAFQLDLVKMLLLHPTILFVWGWVVLALTWRITDV
jgi:hypothetical protein